MSVLPIPLIVLGGRDRRPLHLPEAGRGKHPLGGYKAVELQILGRPLIAVLVERLRASRAFDPIYIAGPARLYRAACPDVEIIDTDGELSDNIRTSVRHVMERHPGRPIAFTTCDILPDVEELRVLAADWVSRQPADFWLPQIRVPDDPARLGASGWKPQYRFAPAPGEPPVATLPGHLVIVDPLALRLELIYRLFGLAYRTRNRSVAYRRTVMLCKVLGNLLLRDLRLLASLRAPTATWEVVSNGLAIARVLRAGNVSTDSLAALCRNLFARHQHRKEHPERRAWLPVLDGLSIAKDVDTEEEAREIARRLEAPRAG